MSSSIACEWIDNYRMTDCSIADHWQVYAPISQAWYLPAATKLWPRLCFYTCLWFCSQGGSLENPLGTKENPPGPGRPPQDQGEPPQIRQGEPPQIKETPPRTKENPPQDQADTPPDQGEPPPGPGKPPLGRRLQHTVNKRPVRILLECILVQWNFRHSVKS